LRKEIIGIVIVLDEIHELRRKIRSDRLKGDFDGFVAVTSVIDHDVEAFLSNRIGQYASIGLSRV